MLKVKISIEDDSGKHVEVELSEADNLSKLVIIQNVFNLFGINTDIMDMVKTFNKAGNAYSSFFNQVTPVEPSINKTKSEKDLIKSELSENLILHKDELKATYEEIDDQPEFVRTGIKSDDNGVKRYRCHYKCEACYSKGSHYIFEHSKTTWCHRCQHEMNVFPAHPEGKFVQDTFGNFFRAGDFKDWNLWD